MPNTIILDVKGEKEGIIVTYIKPGLNYQRGENIVFESKIQDIQSFGTMVDASSTLYSLRDLNDSLEEWGKNVNNTWDLKVEIGEGKYLIYIQLDENKNKSK